MGDVKERSKLLREHPALGWEESATPTKIWCFGDDLIGPNVVTERTQGVAYLNEVKDSIVGGFKWACQEGPMCEERLRGVKLVINDVVLHADAIHRGMGQISPTSKRASYASIYMAEPALQEPVFLANIICPQPLVGSIYNVMSMRRGSVETKAMVCLVVSPICVASCLWLNPSDSRKHWPRQRRVPPSLSCSLITGNCLMVVTSRTLNLALVSWLLLSVRERVLRKHFLLWTATLTDFKAKRGQQDQCRVLSLGGSESLVIGIFITYTVYKHDHYIS